MQNPFRENGIHFIPLPSTPPSFAPTIYPKTSCCCVEPFSETIHYSPHSWIGTFSVHKQPSHIIWYSLHPNSQIRIRNNLSFRYKSWQKDEEVSINFIRRMCCWPERPLPYDRTLGVLVGTLIFSALLFNNRTNNNESLFFSHIRFLVVSNLIIPFKSSFYWRTVCLLPCFPGGGLGKCEEIGKRNGVKCASMYSRRGLDLSQLLVFEVRSERSWKVPFFCNRRGGFLFFFAIRYEYMAM